MFPAKARSKHSKMLYQFLSPTQAVLLEDPEGRSNYHIGQLVTSLINYSEKSWWVYIDEPIGVPKEKIDLFKKVK